MKLGVDSKTSVFTGETPYMIFTLVTLAIQGNIYVRILKVRNRVTDLPSVHITTNHMSISHHQDDIGDFHILTLK